MIRWSSVISFALAVTAAMLASAGGEASQEGGVIGLRNGVTCRTVSVAMRDGVQLTTDVYLPPAPGHIPSSSSGRRTDSGSGTGASSAPAAAWRILGRTRLCRITQDCPWHLPIAGLVPSRSSRSRPTATTPSSGPPHNRGRTAGWGWPGTSYFGVTQWQAALTSPPHLLAIAPEPDGDRLPRPLDLLERRLRLVVRAELAAELLLARRVPAAARSRKGVAPDERADRPPMTI